MALPTSYLTSTKNLTAFFNALKIAQAPGKFTIKFLESLDFKSGSDRLLIGLLKSLGFLTPDNATPTERYFKFLDQTQSAIVLAEAIRQTYADLFQINTSANTMTKAEVLNKFKTLTQGQYSASVLDKMALTFVELCKQADFNAKAAELPKDPPPLPADEDTDRKGKDGNLPPAGRINFGGLHYNIQLILPESRDPKVYDVLFRSLREHLG